MPVVDEVPEEYMNEDIVSKASSILSSQSLAGSVIGEPTAILQIVLQMLADSEFQATYRYKYSKNGYECRPPKSLGGNRPADKTFTIIGIDLPWIIIGQNLDEYLKATIFSTLDLPSWVEGSALAALSSIIKNLWSNSGQTAISYSQTFFAPDDKSDSISCDSTITYIIDGILCYIYYMGVYYNTISPVVETRNVLQHKAYDSFSRFSDGRGINDITQLDAGLRDYSLKAFQQQFGFDFNKNPPDSLLAEGADNAYIARNWKLSYFENPKTDKASVSDYVENHIFSGLNMTLPSVKNSALANAVNAFQSALQSGSVDQWYISPATRTYKPADPTANPVRENTLLLYFNRSERAANGKLVTLAYIYIFTVFYEMLPAEERAVKALFVLLCNNLAARLQAEGSNRLSTTFATPSADAAYLKDLLFEYSKQEFKQGFNFDYAGINSKPPDANSNRIEAFPELFQVNHETVIAKEVEDWIDAEVFRKDSRTFPDFANNTIWEEIRDTALQCITESCTRPDWWFHTRVQKVYRDPAGGVGIKQYAIYMYAKGVMELEGVRVTRTFVYYLGVFCGYV